MRSDFQIVEYTPNSRLIVSQVNADARLKNEAEVTAAEHVGYGQGAAIKALRAAGLKVLPAPPAAARIAPLGARWRAPAACELCRVVYQYPYTRGAMCMCSGPVLVVWTSQCLLALPF